MTTHEKQRGHRRRPRSGRADANKTNSSHERRRHHPTNPTNPTLPHDAPTPTSNAPTKMSPALAACWTSLLLPAIRLPSSSAAASSSSSSTSSKSRTPTLTSSPYLLTDLHSAPSPRVVRTTKPKQPRLAYSHARIHQLTTRDDPEDTTEADMPRRKRRTDRPLHLEVPALADAADRLVLGETSPRSIRNSLEETNVDIDGHVRQSRKGSVSITFERLHDGTAADSDSTTNGLKNLTETGDNGVVATGASASAAMGPAEPDFHEDEEPPVEYSANPAVPANDAVLAQLTGAQLWVHRLLATHHHTLRELGLELEAFPNTRLSLKQIEAVMSPVIKMCSYMTPEQFGIREPSPTMARTMSEVHYWKLWESDSIDIGIFFMPPGGVIPLHNHPGMSVITRVLYGSANVTSYDLMPKSQLADLPADEVQAGQDDIKWARVSRQGDFVAECTMWLDPRRFNLHQIRANDQIGCALLDIMIPPYNNTDRDCHHFEILVERILERNQDRIVKLLESVQPDHHNEPSTSGSSSTSHS